MPNKINLNVTPFSYARNHIFNLRSIATKLAIAQPRMKNVYQKAHYLVQDGAVMCDAAFIRHLKTIIRNETKEMITYLDSVEKELTKAKQTEETA